MKLLTPNETAERLRVSLSTVHRLTRRGQLEFVRIGRSVRYPEDGLTDYINSHRRGRVSR